jgi:ribonuclease HI
MEYSIIGKVPILIECAIEMARNKERNLQEPDNRKARDFLTSTAFYKEINILPNEIAAKRLADAPKVAIQKYENDYALMGMTGLAEWRRPVDEDMTEEDLYNQGQYELILPPNKAYKPDIFSTMEENSEKMLRNMIQHTELKPTDHTRKIIHGKERLSDSEILRRATLNNTIPLMIATDGSFKDGSATASMVILGPDAREEDEKENEWSNREAIPLLARAFQVPREFGTEKATNNTAELIGIIIAAISVPTDMVQLIITDSKTAMSNTCNVMEIKTHSEEKSVFVIRLGERAVSHSG